MISTRAVVATVPCGKRGRGVVGTRPSWPPAWTLVAWLLFMLSLLFPIRLHAQDEAGRGIGDTTATADSGYTNGIAGEFTPARGFDLVKTPRASLNISFYGVFRYVNQLPEDQTFTDHLGRERAVKLRNDLNWHRTMVWLTGFFWEQNFRYNITLWSLPTTQQTLLFGNMQYRFSKAATLGVGIAPNLTARSLTGSWPFWASSDRQMSEEFFRGGFSSGVWLTGEAFDRFNYTLSLNTNISQLGTTAANDTRDMATSLNVAWMPTTGEFGPRGGLGDFEHHREVATRFGLSAGHSREGRYADDDVPPNATQIKLSDGVNPFDTGALAEGVTVQKLTYDEIAIDGGAKYRGFNVQAEYFWRWLSDYETDVPLPAPAAETIFDHGFQAQVMHMVVPRRLGAYLTYGKVFDDFDRNPWELSGGLSYYPSGTRSWRVNLHSIYVDKSPTASSFGFYTSGQTGTTISLGVDILM